MNDDNYISLDIETSNIDMKAEGLKFDNPEGWRIACVCVYDAACDREWFYAPYEMMQKINHGRLFRRFLFSLDVLEDHLWSWMKQGRVLIGHNTTGFDIPIMSKPIEEGGAGCEKVLKKFGYKQQIDMALTLSQVTGKRYRLQHLVHGLLGEDVSKLMDASLAPVEWEKENYAQVLEYCISDCRLTLDAYLAAKEQGEFKAIAKRRNYPTVSFEDFNNTRLRKIVN